jgi:DNA-binding transcriptional regulator GbsR (MarR family)
MEGIEKEFVDVLEESGRMQGLDILLTSIYARLQIEPNDMAMDDLAKETGYSLASISSKVKLLETCGMIVRVKKPGTKKVFLSAEKDILEVWKQQLMRKERMVIRIVKEKLPPIIEKYKGKKNQKDKLALVENYYLQILTLEKVLKEMVGRLEELK